MNSTERRLLSTAFAVILLVSCSVHVLAADPVDESEIKARVEHFVARYFHLAPGDSVKVKLVWPVDDPPMWGLWVTRVQNGATHGDVYMLSKDMKLLTLGRALDFTRDFDQENRDKVDLQEAPSTGPADAPVTLIQYCDLQCPDCKAMVDNLRKVLPDYGDQVRVVFKNFLLMDKHPWAEAASLGARCAYMQSPGAFWSYYDFFYDEQTSITPGNIRDKILTLGKDVGLDAGELAACYDDQASLEAVQDDMYEAAKLGVRGTPTLLVNGRFIFNEFLDEQAYRTILDDALQEAGDRSD